MIADLGYVLEISFSIIGLLGMTIYFLIKIVKLIKRSNNEKINQMDRRDSDMDWEHSYINSERTEEE